MLKICCEQAILNTQFYKVASHTVETKKSIITNLNNIVIITYMYRYHYITITLSFPPPNNTCKSAPQNEVCTCSKCCRGKFKKLHVHSEFYYKAQKSIVHTSSSVTVLVKFLVFCQFLSFVPNNTRACWCLIYMY